MRRLALFACRLVPTLALIAGLVWTWQTNPLAQPLVARSALEFRQALDRAAARQVTQGWLDRQLAAALAADEIDHADLLIEIGAERRPPVRPDPALAALHAERSAAAARLGRRVAACTRCAVDATACRSAGAIAACLVPFELSPAGDLNALRRELGVLATGGTPDRLTVGLAVLGLGATATLLIGGPASGTVKLGATVLRVSRRLGTLSAGFGRDLTRLAQIEPKAVPLARYVAGRGPLDAAVDVRRLDGLARAGAAVGEVARRTSPAEALLLLRHVETAEDAARLARVARSVGPDTRKYFTALGRNRVFRALVRLSDAAIGAMALIYLTAVQLLCAVAQFLGQRVTRGLAVALRTA